MAGTLSIWVDADACPAPVKDILFRASTRTGLSLTLVANKLLRVPPSPVIRAVQVAHGFDAADRYIEEAVTAGDLVITADIPLAAAVLVATLLPAADGVVQAEHRAVGGHGGPSALRRVA